MFIYLIESADVYVVPEGIRRLRDRHHLLRRMRACDSASTTIPADTAQQADCPECRLRERVESAQLGDTINIAAGTYTMTGRELVIDRDLTLVGAGAEVTIIRAAAPRNSLSTG